MNDTFMDDYLAEEKEGFRHTNEGIVVPVFQLLCIYQCLLMAFGAE